MKEGSKVPRKGFIAKREVLPDPIYNNVVVTKLINNIMLDGKKGPHTACSALSFQVLPKTLQSFQAVNRPL